MNFRKIILTVTGMLILSFASAQYLGMELKRLGGSIKWDCLCPFVLTYSDEDKAVFEFADEIGVTSMTFYFNSRKKCFGYMVSYHKSFDETINGFIETNFEFKPEDDMYENKKSYLFYEATNERKMIHVLSKFHTSN